MNCHDYGSAALNKVYGGMNCQTHPRDLPFTGSELILYVILGALLIAAGIVLKLTAKESAV
jgi:hypothetical protein